MSFIFVNLNMLGPKCINTGDFVAQNYFWEGFRLAGKLFRNSCEVIFVYMRVAERVDEFTGLAPENFCDDVAEQGVACDVERHAKKKVGASLVQLKAYFAVLDVELVHVVAYG